MRLPFSPDLAARILHRVGERGWNAYDSTDVERVGRDATLAAGPAETLALNRRYVLMPRCSAPTNPTAVMQALEAFAQQNGLQTPKITVHGACEPWTGFIPYAAAVKVNTPSGVVIPYDSFLAALGTMTASSSPRRR